MIKAIFIDIDGTLRDSNRNLSQKTIDTIKKISEKGILVILCSGRPRKYTEQISRECFASKYIITSSGGNIYDYEKNEILYVNKMNKKALIELYNIATPENVRFIMNVGEGRVVNKVKHPDQEKKLEENIEDFVYNNDVVQCTIADSNFNKIKNLIPKIEKVQNVEIKNRHKSLLDIKFKDNQTVFCDIANIESNKGIAVKKLLEILDIKKEEAIAIGDDNNDLSMFEQVGYKIAVSNAIDIVKEKADEITLSNDENGVAVFLEKLLKKINDMEAYTMLENFESVSPTAILTSYPRTFTDIPYEKDIYKWLAQNCNGNVTLNKQIAPDMEARYKLTNSLLDKSNIKQVLEIAAGYSSRGLIYSQKGYNYVEMDLEEVSRNKTTIIKNIIEIPTNLNIISGNALNSKDYEKCENFLNINSPIAVINEGLMRYLTFEEKRIVAENVYSLLKKYNGIWINCDLTPKKFIQTQNKFLPDFNKNLNNTTSRNRLNDRFNDFNHMKEFFNRIGFNDIEIHKFIEMKPYLSCFDILHIDKDSMDEYLENAIVTVMRI